MAGTRHFFAHGKLLITSEYTVLHGAWALAVPTQKGQHLRYTPGAQPLTWEARDCHGIIWLQGEVATSPELAWVQTCLQAALDLAGRLTWPTGSIRTDLEFERAWGWGSSSTLISLIAQWIGVDPMDLHFAVSHGSGYDVACAQATGAILYRRHGSSSEMRRVDMEGWPIEHLYLAYLGQKSDSQAAVGAYLNQGDALQAAAHTTRITLELLEAQSPTSWARYLLAHERFMGQHLGAESTVLRHFTGASSRAHSGGKSLGAWGGDFALICDAHSDALNYLHQCGYAPVFPWKEVVLHA